MHPWIVWEVSNLKRYYEIGDVDEKCSTTSKKCYCISSIPNWYDFIIEVSMVYSVDKRRAFAKKYTSCAVNLETQGSTL